MSFSIKFHSALLGIPFTGPGFLSTSGVHLSPGLQETHPSFYCSAGDDDRPIGGGGVSHPQVARLLSELETLGLTVEEAFRLGEIEQELLGLGEGIVEDLVAAMLDPERSLVGRMHAIGALKMIGSAQAVKGLARAFAEKDPINLIAVGAMGKIQSALSIEALVGVLSERKEDLNLRAAAAKALGEAGDVSLLPLFQKIVREIGIPDKKTIRLKKQAIAAMGKIGGLIPKEKNRIVELTRMKSGQVFGRFIEMESNAVEKEDPAAVQAIAALLPKLSGELRQFALSVLNRIPVSADPTPDEELREILDDMSPDDIGDLLSGLMRDEEKARKKQ